MAILSNTFLRYDASGLREQLANMIWDISPTDTPISSGAGRMEATQTFVEWQTDSLAAAATDNRQIEGEDYDSAGYTALTATTRVGNYTQISAKDLIVSGTLDVVSKAGRGSEIAYQLPRKAKELRRDLESAITSNSAAVAGNSTTARVSAGLPVWIKTNDDLGATGASSTYTTGAPTPARTDGTQRAFTETIHKSVVQSVWNSGGDPKVLVVGPVNKQRVSETFGGITTQTSNMPDRPGRPTTAIAAIDLYQSDFGLQTVVPNRFQRERDGFVLDFDFVSIASLRDFRTMELAKTGDAEKRLLLHEWTLVVKNEAALGLAADLTTT